MPAPIPEEVGPLDRVWSLSARWSYSGFGLSESSWTLISSTAMENADSLIYLVWSSYLEDLFCTARPSEWELDFIVIKDVYPGTKPERTIEYIPGRFPDSLGKGCAPQVSGLLSWRSGAIGRSWRGRTFWGPVRDADMESDGFIGGDARAAMSDFGDAMFFHWGPTIPVFFPFRAVISHQHDLVPLDPPWFIRPQYFNILRYAKTIRRRNHSPNL